MLLKFKDQRKEGIANKKEKKVKKALQLKAVSLLSMEYFFPLQMQCSLTAIIF
jgi:hypothetical protein